MKKKYSERVEILSNQGQIKVTDSGLPNLIELRGVSQTYDNGKTFIIKDLDFLIEDKPDQGQFCVILGKSGCGKSTLLRYIAGLQTPSSGKVLIKDQPKKDDYPVSMVFQKYSSLPWYSVLENVMLPLKYLGVAKSEREDRAMAMIKRVHLEGQEKKFAQYPLLSGGQLQRVAIARSLISNPEFLLMDEPFGALDAYTRASMQALIQEIWSELKLTIIFVTHDIPEAVFLGDDIYIMGTGPGRLISYLHIDLPLDRKRDIKTTPPFIEYVKEIESILMA